ncbi:MAG TPA: cysteine--tRNA ligase, partial [Cyanobacteria bacterium UBA11368]|nr:cysteine--tRNA ligase [Cyanobacteria bacterium UBA11368]
VDGEKMAKSVGNFTTIRQFLDAPNGLAPMALRLFVLQAHYRKPIDFTPDAIASAKNSWETLKEGLLFGYEYGNKLGWKLESGENSSIQNSHTNRFQEAMDDDINTPGGLAVLFELAKELRREANILIHQGKTETPPEELEQQWRTLVSLAAVLGLQVQPEAETIEETGGISDGEIEALIQQRQDARKAKNFALSDRIRNELQAQGIALIDTPQGTRWHRN